MSNPIVSVCCITYNHQKYIEKCLEGFLMQQTNFDFEILIHDDASTDKTATIIREYEKQYPDIIKPIYQKENQYSKGVSISKTYNYPRAQGKYIALCEGDDYWTDPLKLQKQVDFLENNQDYGICFHNVLELNTLNKETQKVIPNVLKNHTYSIYDYIQNNKTATCSILFKAELFNPVPSWFQQLPFGDLGLILFVLKNSNNQKGYVLKDIMGVYRIHAGGVHGSLQENSKTLISAFKQHITFITIIKKNLLCEMLYKKHILKKYIKAYSNLMVLYRKEGDKINYWKFKLLKMFKQINIKLCYE
ncbi:glycosyltransferase family 2 protein [Winogradskyella bathintestinalis]|uniref:Glycosyltransferase n=1 Tax=Winogradskyella bathintestinalis TaxID=3035208 RepID=A0ABT7ZTZ2_9FLAO|nr:glycosyltransferase [Winogradskyella bathintestinalis]MDN3492433.1 glycosyltransferase [Winogradskyella bathintestinalis]